MDEITVVILTYNGAVGDIIATINSAIMQKNIKIKLIISDDCSLNFEKKYYEMYLEQIGFSEYIILTAKNNRGTVNNALSSIKFVKTEYVKFISQGDLFYDEYTLSKITKYMKDGKYKIAFGKLCGYYPDDFEKKCIYYSPIDIKPYLQNNYDKIKQNFILYLNGPCGAAHFYETKTAIKYLNMINKNVKYCEDNILSIALLDNIKIGYFRDYFVWYQVGLGISSSKSENAIDRMKLDQIDFYNLLYKIRPSKLTKVAQRIYSYNLIKNKLARKILKFIVYPPFLLHKFLVVIDRKTTKRELNINNANKEFLYKCFEKI